MIKEMTNNKKAQNPVLRIRATPKTRSGNTQSMHTQVPGLSVLPRKHRQNNNKGVRTTFNNITVK